MRVNMLYVAIETKSTPLRAKKYESDICRQKVDMRDNSAFSTTRLTQLVLYNYCDHISLKMHFTDDSCVTSRVPTCVGLQVGYLSSNYPSSFSQRCISKWRCSIDIRSGRAFIFLSFYRIFIICVNK